MERPRLGPERSEAKCGGVGDLGFTISPRLPNCARMFAKLQARNYMCLLLASAPFAQASVVIIRMLYSTMLVSTACSCDSSRQDLRGEIIVSLQRSTISTALGWTVDQAIRYMQPPRAKGSRPWGKTLDSPRTETTACSNVCLTKISSAAATLIRGKFEGALHQQKCQSVTPEAIHRCCGQTYTTMHLSCCAFLVDYLL